MENMRGSALTICRVGLAVYRVRMCVCKERQRRGAHQILFYLSNERTHERVERCSERKEEEAAATETFPIFSVVFKPAATQV